MLTLILSGCQTGQTLGNITLTVDGARKVYSDAINLNLVSASEEAAIDQYIEDYQDAMNLALTAAQLDLETASSQEVAALGGKITAAVIRILNRNPQLIPK